MKETLESAIKKLEKITDSLEKNDLPLEEAMKLYEEGLKLTSFCNEVISGAEKKIKHLSGEKDKDLELFKDE